MGACDQKKNVHCHVHPYLTLTQTTRDLFAWRHPNCFGFAFASLLVLMRCIHLSTSNTEWQFVHFNASMLINMDGSLTAFEETNLLEIGGILWQTPTWRFNYGDYSTDFLSPAPQLLILLFLHKDVALFSHTHEWLHHLHQINCMTQWCHLASMGTCVESAPDSFDIIPWIAANSYCSSYNYYMYFSSTCFMQTESKQVL